MKDAAMPGWLHALRWLLIVGIAGAVLALAAVGLVWFLALRD